MAVLGSSDITHGSDFKINIDNTDMFTITSTGRVLAGQVTVDANPSINGIYADRVHTNDYIAGRLYFQNGWRNTANGQGGWALRSPGSGEMHFININTTANAGTAITPQVRLSITGDGVIRTHTGTGHSATISPSGNDIVQLYQNRNGTTPFWFFNTAGNFGVFSDMRLKENISEVSNKICLDYVAKLVPIEFNWKPEYGNHHTRLIGFSAQNIFQSSITEGQKNAITNWECYDENNTDCPFLGLADHRLIPSLVGAIKELISKIETLETKVEQLEAI
jgi:hypothetical protein